MTDDDGDGSGMPVMGLQSILIHDKLCYKNGINKMNAYVLHET